MSDLTHQVATVIAQGYGVDRLPEVNHHDLRAASLLLESETIRTLLAAAWLDGRDSYSHDMIHQVDAKGNRLRSENPFKDTQWLARLQK